jgi:hypothetical protein
LEEKTIVYEVYEADAAGRPLNLQGQYDTVAEVLAHCEAQSGPRVVKVGDEVLNLDIFMERYVAAG